MFQNRALNPRLACKFWRICKAWPSLVGVAAATFALLGLVAVVAPNGNLFVRGTGAAYFLLFSLRFFRWLRKIRQGTWGDFCQLFIDYYQSMETDSMRLQHDAVAALQANRIDTKLLYVTPRQSELWRQVFQRHSPIHTNPEFARIYRESFTQVTDALMAKKVWLIGLGCGTGTKEAELCSRLTAAGREVYFSAVDISHDLVRESVRTVTKAGAKRRKSLVCDLARISSLHRWLVQQDDKLPRLFTFFGLVPNLPPDLVVAILKSVLRTGDRLLVSAHLAPVGDGIDTAAAMRRVLSQYDNAETLKWLTAALEVWGLRDRVEAPVMTIGKIGGIPAFVAEAKWKTDEPFERWGARFFPRIDESLECFHSLRYTPELFENMLNDAGLSAKLLAITACREEAIWVVRKK